MHVNRILSFINILFFTTAVWSSPLRTTYQARIVKPDGLALESANVNFKFTVLNPSGDCILYSETYSSLSMRNSGGLISVSLGTGISDYNASGTTTFAKVFNNSLPNLSCQDGSTYSPASADIRKIVVQFSDGTGWQTLPALVINAVPYAIYSQDSQNLGGVAASDFIRHSTTPNCSSSQILSYSNGGFTCVEGEAVTVISADDVINALGYTPVNTNGDQTSFTTVTDSVATLGTSFTTLATSHTFLVSTVNEISTSLTTLLASPIVQSLNGSTSATQTFSVGTNGDAPAITTLNGVHTLNLPLASASPTVAAGLISNFDYERFSNKLEATNAAIIAALGFTPANNAVSGTYVQRSSNLSDLASIPAARTNLGLGTLATANSLDLGSASATGIISDARLANSGVTAGTYTKLTVDIKGRVSSGAALTSSDVTNALGYIPANNAVSGTYVQRSSNLSDLASIPAARTNLGLGALATANAVDLGSASAAGILATARLPGFSGDVTSLSGTNSLSVVALRGRSLLATAPTTGQSLAYNGSAWTPTTVVSSQWVSSGSAISYDTGNVGIGTATPTQKLEVAGNVLAQKFMGLLNSADTRAVVDTPETVASPGAAFDFKQNSTNSLSDGGTYNGVMTFRPYGNTTDWTGGPSHQIGFTANGNLYHRSGASTSWGSWKKIIESDAFNSSIAGTNNYVPKFNGTNSVTNSQLFDNGTNVGVGTAAPTQKLEVAGNVLASGNILATGSVNYGTSGLRTEAAADAGSQLASGFYETSAPAPAGNWYPSATSWQHLLNVRHSEASNNYQMQIAGSFFDNNFWGRKTNGSGSTAWNQFITRNPAAATTDVGSSRLINVSAPVADSDAATKGWTNTQITAASVNYASTAGNASTVGGVAATSFIRHDVAGDWQIASSNNSAGYNHAALEVRELNFAGAQSGANSESPRIGFHWAGRVASQIGMGADGAIKILNNPGTAFEVLQAGTIYSNGSAALTTATMDAPNKAGTSYYQANTWLQFNGGTSPYGIYFPGSGAGTHFVPSTTTYGSFAVTGGKNGYQGFVFSDLANSPTFMISAGAGGVYRQGTSQWDWHYDNSQSNFRIGPSAHLAWHAGNFDPAVKLSKSGDTLSEVYNNGWYRSNGNAGWYSETYGGGIYMTDTTWVRTYNEKNIWTGAGILGSNGGLSAGYSGTVPPAGGAVIAGNVGIGTATPSVKLDVVGAVKGTQLCIGADCRSSWPSGGGGSVTGVTASPPLASSGGAAPNITIAQAGIVNDGYITSADWNTFHAKQTALGYTPVNKAGDTMAGTLNMNSNKVTNLGAPTAGADAATKSYVDTAVAGAGGGGGGGAVRSNVRFSRTLVFHGQAISARDAACVTDFGSNYQAASRGDLLAYWTSGGSYAGINGIGFLIYEPSSSGFNFQVGGTPLIVGASSSTAFNTDVACIRKDAILRFSRTLVFHGQAISARDAACVTDFGSNYQAASRGDLLAYWTSGGSYAGINGIGFLIYEPSSSGFNFQVGGTPLIVGASSSTAFNTDVACIRKDP